MSWLTPLGFLGLIGILVILIIYMIKPNFQQKVVSSTVIWKLSLRYRKKKLPLNKIRNILLFICQCLLVVACALILAQPYILAEQEEVHPERVVILDASASMLCENSRGVSRFNRAVDEVWDYTQDLLSQDGYITIILAGTTPSYIAQHAGAGQSENIRSALYAAECTFGHAAIDSSISMAENILQDNPNAEVLLYTGTTYIDKGIVEVVNVGEANEWNAAILDCTAELVENDYVFSVKVASYDRPTDLMLLVDVKGANSYDGRVGFDLYDLRVPVRCEVDALGKAVTTKLDIRIGEYTNALDYVTSFESVYLRFLDVEDSFDSDNSFYVYNGTRDSIKIQMWSTDQNSFSYVAWNVIADTLRRNRDITFKQVRKSLEPEVEGYDIYVFEHSIPQNVLDNGLPTDGVIVLLDPDENVKGVDITLGDEVSLRSSIELTTGVVHPLTNYMDPSRITVSKYRKIVQSSGFDELYFCGGDPVLLAKNDVDSKIVVMPFSVNNSSITTRWDFAIFLTNIVNYYFPLTTEKYVLDVNESLSVNSKAGKLDVSGPWGLISELETFPEELVFTEPGSYKLSQLPISGIEEVRSVYVKIPEEECNIFREVDVLTRIQIEKVVQEDDFDLLIFVAAALAALVVIEWWLQAKENFF